MALPASGAITLGQVNTELGLSATALLNMNDSAVRTLAQVGVSPATISMQNLRGKNSAALGFDSANDFNLEGEFFQPAAFTFSNNGGISASAGTGITGPTRYFFPFITGNGADFEIQVSYSTNIPTAGVATILGTQVFTSATGVVLYNSLATAKTIQIETANPYDDPVSMTFNVLIRKISTGATISRNGAISIG